MMAPRILILGAAAVAVLGYAIYRPKTFTPLRPTAATTPHSNIAGGYFSSAPLPDAVKVIAPPPAAGSAAMQRDEAARDAALKLYGSARYAEAAADSSRAISDILHSFSCPVGAAITKEQTPRLYQLLTRMMIDVREATYPVKNQYNRPRPFVVYHTNTCSPQDESLVQSQGSYPSGQSAVGWSFALVLAETNPARAELILQRGRDFGQSRVICDAQWQSDVDAGRDVARLVVARLHNIPAFAADLAAAKQEVAKQTQGGRRQDSACGSAAKIASR